VIGLLAPRSFLGDPALDDLLARREEERRKREEQGRRYAAAAQALKQDASKFTDDTPWNVLASNVTEQQIAGVDFPKFEVRFNGELLGIVGFTGGTWFRYAQPYFRKSHATHEEAVEELVRLALRELRNA
jgi:hypothetical protein